MLCAINFTLEIGGNVEVGFRYVIELLCRQCGTATDPLVTPWPILTTKNTPYIAL